MFICHSPLTTYEKPLPSLHKLIVHIGDPFIHSVNLHMKKK